MTTNDWWNAPCEPMGGCITAFMQGDHFVVWPVWRNPQDPNYFTVKVHDLKRDKWERHTGFFCANHVKLLLQDWEVSTLEDVNWMEATDRWAVKNGGRQ